MTTVAELEKAAYDTWTPDRSTRIGDWCLYATDGFTRRVNCATAHGSPGVDGQTREAVQAWLNDNGAALVVRVTPLLSDDTQATISTNWGFEPFDETVVMAAPAEASYDESIRLVDVGDNAFFADINRLNDRSDSSVPAWKRLLERVRMRAAGIWVPDVAAGLVVCSGNLAAVYSVAVHPDHRREGIARRMMQSATAWAVDRGADTMFLQVHGENDAAIGLYDALGYQEQYRYWYLQQPNDTATASIDGC